MMYCIDFNNAENTYEPAELVRMFLSEDMYEIAGAEKKEIKRYFSSKEEADAWEAEKAARTAEPRMLLRVPDDVRQKDDVKRWLYRTLSEQTGKTVDWGILTGVRPVKLYGELVRAYGSSDAVEEILREDYYLSPGKIRLLRDTYEVQNTCMTAGDGRRIALYLGIPFCPTRCLYCSFTSNQLIPEELERYLEALYREIRYCGERTRNRFEIESVYIGGGTPTTLSPDQLRAFLGEIRSAFDLSACKEFTVESGRPDTITEDKIRAILESGGDRISINPQTMKQETLERIGRAHTAEDIRSAFAAANRVRAEMPRKTLIVNTDLIAGLPGETAEDFENTMRQVISFAPENITVHTLAVKRGSRLHEEDKDFSYARGECTRKMLEIGWTLLEKAGYKPYYLYRQKQMTGNFENVGYAKPGTENLYNIKIMEENQTILALGAGGISKVWYPETNRIDRVPNVSNYRIYIERLEEMLERKEKGIFQAAEEIR